MARVLIGAFPIKVRDRRCCLIWEHSRFLGVNGLTLKVERRPRLSRSRGQRQRSIADLLRVLAATAGVRPTRRWSKGDSNRVPPHEGTGSPAALIEIVSRPAWPTAKRTVGPPVRIRFPPAESPHLAGFCRPTAGE